MYRTIEDLPPTTRAGLFVERLAEMDTTTLMPVVLELFVSWGHKTEDRDAALADLASFLVRRMICRLTPKNYNRLAVDLLKSLADGDGSPRDRLRKVLLASDDDTLRWPSDAEFSERVQGDPMYIVLTRKRLRMFLRSLEQHLRTSKTEDTSLSRKLTVEHLLPRRWQQHWPLPPQAAQDAEERRDLLLHTLGNLTLLTKKLNTSVSNGPWDKKLVAIAQHSVLRLNNELTANHAARWDEATIVARGKVLAALACKIWPRP